MTRASHIVGGEFEIIHLQDFTYQINLILYFDVNNGSPGAFDNEIVASVFRKSDDRKVRDYFLPFRTTSRVDYFQPECSTGEVVTDKIIYNDVVVLSPEIYNDPEGYYIVWQRCCRNYTITNIYSDNPNIGTHAGQTFYLEFPPVVDENDEPFVNSSPQLFPPLNDYACPNRPYWVDFAGVDVDDDSLVYSLVDPLSTQFNSALPPDGNLSAPYPPVQWKPSFGLNNIVNGFPDLQISTDGFLTVTPQSQGLFVFAVKVEEYRDSVKIGEVRRDFQMLVVDKCPVADPPQILGRKIDGSTFFDEDMYVEFNQGINDEERCVVVEVSDPDASKMVDNFEEDVFIKAIPIGFKDNVFEVLPNDVTATLVNGSTVEFEICFPECPYVEEGPFQVGIVAFDDACALPLTDTLRITVNTQPPPNTDPYFVNSDINVIRLEEKGGFYSTDIIGRDSDNDSLYVNFFPDGFVLEDYGMSLERLSDERGEIITRFNWNYDCIETSFDGQTQFEILAVLDDYDFCLFAHPDTLTLNLEIILPDNTFPEISTDAFGTPDEKFYRFEREIYETIGFPTFSSDLDNDPIIVGGEGANFDFAEFGVSFPTVEGNGNPGLSNPFEWELNCDLFDLAEQDSFRLYLYVEDIDYCNITSKDTLTLDVIVIDPGNNEPETTFSSGNGFLSVTDNVGSITVGDPMVLNILAQDQDPNNVSIELLKVEGENDNQNFSFQDVTSFRTATSQLIWTPDCSSLVQGQPSSEYTFYFRISDDYCTENADYEVSFTLEINDIEPEPIQFNPPNFFSPNGDDKNPFFALEWEDENGQVFTTGLPLDNCAGTFIEVVIINRWGKEVYRSDKRDFRWYGNGEPSGVYFYYVRYTNREFKGTITMLY